MRAFGIYARLTACVCKAGSVLLLLHFLLCAVAVAASSDPERTGFTITRTELDVRLSEVDQSADIAGKLWIRNDGAISLPRVFLQLTSTSKWLGVEREGVSLVFTEHQVKSDADHTGAVNEARIDFDRPLVTRGTTVLNVRYTLKVVHSSQRLTAVGAPAGAALRTDWDRISTAFTAARGVGYVEWYPVSLEPAHLTEGNSVFQSLASWRAREAESSFVANIQAGDRRSTKVYEPLSMAVPVLTNVSAPILVRNGVAVAAESPAIAEALAFTDDAESFAATWLPQRSATAKVWELPEEGDVPYSSGTDAFVSLAGARDAQSVTLYAVEHAALKSPRPWIQEGYAAFLDAAYREHAQGREAALKFLDDRMGALALSEPENVNSGETNLINSAEESRYRSKAMFVWWMLRDIVGDSALQRAIKQYKAQSDRSADYMQKLIEGEAHRDLSWFFDDWVYRDRGIAELSIVSAIPRQTLEGKWITEVTVANSGGVSTRVPVFVSAGEDEQKMVLLVPAHGKASGTLTTALKPGRARVNDGSVPETDMSDNELEIK